MNLFRACQTYDKDKVSSILSLRKNILPYIKENAKFHYCIDYRGPLGCVSPYQDSKNVSCTSIWDDLGKDGNKNANVFILSKSALGFKEEKAYLKEISHASAIDREKFDRDRFLRKKLVETHFLDDQAMELLYEDDYVYAFGQSN